MRIGIDARELCGRRTGAGRYLAGLLRQWAVSEQASHHEFVLFAPQPVAREFDGGRFRSHIVPGSPGWRWEQLRVRRAVAMHRPDVWFGPAYTAPLALGIPTIVAIHDVSFAAHPEWFRVREGARRRLLTRQSARQAAAVITISAFSKREIVERLQVPAARVQVIPPGIDQPPTHVPHLHRDDSAAAAPHVLYVGSIFNRRHVPDLIRAFAPISRAHPRTALDIVGDNRTYPHEDLRRTIEAEGLQTPVQWHEYVSDDRLEALYAEARAFAFLSEYEGLGLTPLEAMARGVPAVVLDTPVARESCGAAALYVPEHDLRSITDALEQALFDEDVRTRLLAASTDALAKYSWPRAAAETLAVLEATEAA